LLHLIIIIYLSICYRKVDTGNDIGILDKRPSRRVSSGLNSSDERLGDHGVEHVEPEIQYAFDGISEPRKETSQPSPIDTYSYVRTNSSSNRNGVDVTPRLLNSRLLIRCSFCSKSYSYNKQLIAHHDHAHTDKLHFACSFCKRKFATVSLLTNHVSTHNVETIFKCCNCSKSFNSSVNLVNHKCKAALVTKGSTSYTYSGRPLSDCTVVVDKLPNELPVLLNGLVVHDGRKPDKCDKQVKGNVLHESSEHSLQSRLSGHEEIECSDLELLTNQWDDQMQIKVSRSNRLEARLFVENDFKPMLLTEAILREHDMSSYDNNELDVDYHIFKKELVKKNSCSVSLDGSDRTVPWSPDYEAQSNDAVSHCSEKKPNIVHKSNKKSRYACPQCARQFTAQASLNRHKLTHTNKPRTFNCAFCDKAFLHKHHLKQHQLTHSVERQRSFKCTQCDKGFFHKQNLDKHLPTHVGERFPCSKCGKTFIGVRGLTLHQLIHTTECNYVCTLCDRRFPRLTDLTAHLRRQHRNKDPIVCNQCDISFSKNSAFRAHMRSFHGDESSWLCVHCGETYTKRDRHKHRHLDVYKIERRHSCTHCDKSFALPFGLKTHMEAVHCDKKPCFSCTCCGKYFTAKSSLNAHKVVHSGEKMYACEQCEKTFYRRYDLTMHVRRKHFNDSSYGISFPCMQCEKVFTMSANLRAHVKRMHANERAFLCTQCGNSYTTRASLNTHVLVHGEATHMCAQCDRRFKHPISLRYHMDHVHSDAKPNFQCNICFKAFTSKGSLSYHTLIHTGERRHACENCGKRFTKSHDLKIHIRRVHSNFRPFSCTKCDKKFATKSQVNVHKLLHCSGEGYVCTLCDKRFTFLSAKNRHIKHDHTRSTQYVAQVVCESGPPLQTYSDVLFMSTFGVS